MFNRILVPLDGSTLAERILPHAEYFSRIFGSDIMLLQVLDPTMVSETSAHVDPLSWQIRKAESAMYMQHTVDRIRQELAISEAAREVENAPAEKPKGGMVDFVILEGKTAESIVNYAHTENIDLIMMTTHGAGGLSRWSISSVTQKVINLVYLPVFIERAYGPAPVVDQAFRYRRILLPIDSSRRAESALAVGIALAGAAAEEWRLQGGGEPGQGLPFIPRTGSPTSLLLTAVIKPPELPIPEPYPGEIHQLCQELMNLSREAVLKYLSQMKDRLPVPTDTRVLEHRSVPAAIQELAGSDEEVDLVVFSAHGNTAQFDWPYGSIARNYIDHGTKPVLIIQDVPRSQVKPTAAEIAAEKSGNR